MTFLEDFNFKFNISFSTSNMSKHTDNSFNILLTLFNTENSR